MSKPAGSGKEEVMRYAIYFTPRRDDRLTRAAASWLGRDAFAGESVAAPTLAGLSPAEIAFHTAAARRYGFHATMRAPFHLAPGQSEEALIDAVERFCAGRAPVSLPQVTAARLSGFFAIVPARPSEPLQRLAGDVVTAFEPFRAPLTETDLQRRNPDSLSPAQLKNLYRWGYPYVFDEFRFHMTLTGRIATEDRLRVQAAIDEHFGALLLEPLDIASLALFVEPEPGAPFTVRSFHEMGRVPARKTA